MGLFEGRVPQIQPKERTCLQTSDREGNKNIIHLWHDDERIMEYMRENIEKLSKNNKKNNNSNNSNKNDSNSSNKNNHRLHIFI